MPSHLAGPVRRVVAVDNELANVKQALEREGFQVVGVENAPEDAIALVVSGLDNNLMQMSDRTIRTHIINAAGRDAEEVVREVRRHAELGQPGE